MLFLFLILTLLFINLILTSQKTHQVFNSIPLQFFPEFKGKVSEMKEKKITKDRLLHMLVRALPMIIVLALLAGTALWINRPKEGETAADSSRMVYAPARVTAVLSDNAQEDFENAEGRRVGDQELEIRILSGDHKDEIMTVTNYMSALFNVDVQQGDRIIVRIMTDEDGS